MSALTIGSLVTARIRFHLGWLAACSKHALTSLTVVGRSARNTIADNDPIVTGTRIAIPSNRFRRLGIARATAVAAPVVAGTMLAAAARPRRKSRPLTGVSVKLCVAVYACTVLRNAFRTPMVS